MHEFISHPGLKLIENEIGILIQKQNDLDAHLLQSAKILADKVVSATQDELLKKVFRAECYRIPDSRNNAIKQDAPLLQKIFAEAIIGSQKNYKRSEGIFFVKVNDLSEEGSVDQKYGALQQKLLDARTQFNIEAKTFLNFKFPYRMHQVPDYICLEYICDYKAEFPWK